jgi:hypothetical protein
VTRIVVDVTRDDDGRLHGTVGADGPNGGRADFTGVIELVATIEATLDRSGPGAGHRDPDDPG